MALQRLLLATEGTPQDAGAERIALALARRLGVPLTVVLPLTANEALLEAAPDVALEAEVSAGATLRRLAASAQRAGVRFDTVVRRGSSVAQEIVAAAAAHDADLVVTRRVGRRGVLARLLVGEMVSQVAAQALRPVLLTPASAATLWHAHVVLPQATATTASETLAVAIGAATGAPVAKRVGALAPVIAGVTADDLLVLALRKTDLAAGRLGSDFEAAIGAAACPTLLVPAGTDVAGRA